MSPQATSTGRCVICGTDDDMERHHVGGKNHIAWFTMPLCKFHHGRITRLVAAAPINLEYTDDPKERLIRAQQACQVFLWMLTEAQRQLNSQVNNEQQNIRI